MLLVISGATGTGKTELSLGLAEAIAVRGGAAEIVNADAMQLYRGMDIGTAKLPASERRGIPHHLFDVLTVDQDASVADYQQHARAIVAAIEGRGAVPILVGGSGLYIAAVLQEFEFPGTDPELRAALEDEAAESGVGVLFRRLQQLDPPAAAQIGPHNVRRIIRALEVIAITGEPYTASLPQAGHRWRPALTVLLESPREQLVSRLDARVERMWAAGLVEETAQLLTEGLEQGTTARRAIGYAQAIGQLRGEHGQAEAIAAAQTLTRKYARRQVSWWRREQQALRLTAGDSRNVDAVLAAVAA